MTLAGCKQEDSVQPPAPDAKLSVEKLTVKPNSTGLAFGFWPSPNKQDLVFRDFGKRTTSRIDFRGWNMIEATKGKYTWNGVFDNVKKSHRYGETPIISVNISFSKQITKQKQTIPDFYYPRITDPETRAAAKRFLYAYVQELLQQAGSAMLSIDYEINSNYLLPKDFEGIRTKEWSEWYVEAAKTARQAAADMGMSEQLKLVPIVNGDPIDSDSIYRKGPKANQWLLDVVAASDYLGIDTYHLNVVKGQEPDVTDPKSTIDIIRFWIDNYAGAKDVILCENGFTSVTEIFPDITWKKKEKYAGTEQQQLTYYRRLFSELEKANKPDGVFHNKLRGFHIWSYMDNRSTRKGDYEQSFGLVRLNGTTKPAFGEVRDGIARLERDPFFNPVRVARTENVTERLTVSEQGVALAYNDGNDYDALQVTLPIGSSTIKIVTEKPGYLLAGINDQFWIAQADSAKTEFNLDLAPNVSGNQPISVKLFFTGTVFPFQQQVLSIQTNTQS
jgi:hypothetical protein